MIIAHTFTSVSHQIVIHDFLVRQTVLSINFPGPDAEVIVLNSLQVGGTGDVLLLDIELDGHLPAGAHVSGLAHQIVVAACCDGCRCNGK